MNCNGKWSKVDGGLDVRFQYQGGHFSIQLRKESPYIRLYYLFFHESPLSDIEIVRSLCNQTNQAAETCRLVYSVDERHARVDVHIFQTLLVTDSTVVEVLERAFGDVFTWHTAFVHRFNELKLNKGKDNPDPEKAHAVTNHELFLLREMEMLHQTNGPDWHILQKQGRSLQQLISSTLSLNDLVPITLTIYRGKEVCVIDNPDNILGLDFSAEIVADGHYREKTVVMHLDYYDPRDPRKARHLLVDFEAEGQTEETLYYRASLMEVPSSIQKERPVDSVETERRMCSVLIGVDLLLESKQQEKFRYVWKEALAKVNSEENENLTSDEQMLIGLHSPDLGRFYYEGHTLFLEGRYYEASLRFETLLRSMPTSLVAESKRHRYQYGVLCFYFGFCLLQLRQYQRASYYLELTLPLHNILYTEAYINSIVQMGDYRAINVIDSLLSEVDSDDEGDEDAVASDLVQNEFISFLKRRKAVVLVQLERLDEAEALLKKLLDDPGSSDFALKELAHIQKLKGN